MPVLEALGELARGPQADAVRAALARRAPTWLVELPWLLDESPDAEAVRHRAQGATRARMLREMLEALDAISAAAPVAARARGPPLGRRLHARPARRGAAPPRPRPAARARHVPARRASTASRRSPRSRNDLCVRGAAESLPVGRLPEDAVAAYLRAPLPGRRAARRPGRRARAPRRRQPAVHAQPRRPLARRGRARPRRAAACASRAARPRSSRASRRRCTPTSATSSTRSHADDAELLQAASVAGRRFSIATLAAASGRDADAVELRCARARAPARG